MALYELPNGTSGIDTILIGTVSAVPSFIPAMLFFIFFVVAVGGSLSQKRRTGNADLPVWTTLASITILFVSLVLTLADGLMNTTILGIVGAITIISGLWLFTSSGVREI